MPGIHSPLSRHLITIDGAVKTTGGGNKLPHGQFALIQVDPQGATAQGARVIGTNMGALSPNANLAMVLGTYKVQNPNKVYTNKPMSSEIFKLSDIVSIKVTKPNQQVQEFDSWILGYDGINANSAIELEVGQVAPVEVIFKGEFLAVVTGEKYHIAKFTLHREVGETMQEVIQRLYRQIVEYKFAGNVPLTDLADVRLVDSEAEAPTGTDFNFWTLETDDAGSNVDLARVQISNPSLSVTRVNRNGITSTYSLVAPDGVTPTNYSKTVVKDFIKGCEDCPAGYSTLTGGYLYSVALGDDNANSTSTVQGLPGAVSNTAAKAGRNADGKSTYTVVLDNPLTEAEITSFLAINAITGTAEIENLGLIADLCTDTDTTSIAWVQGDTCTASTELYRLQLADGDCDGSRLAELQAVYPGASITVVENEDFGSVEVTLAGTSGTANINVGGVDYLATFTTNLTTSANNFVTTHSAALTALGISVSANTGVLTFTGEVDALGTITITNATSDLAGTVADFAPADLTGGCQRIYQMSVATNIQCPDCDPIFTGMFASNAPQAFDGIEWTLYNPNTPSDSALMGIKITGKPFIMKPDVDGMYKYPYYETSSEITIVGGGTDEVNESFKPIVLDTFQVKQISWKRDRKNLGWELVRLENESKVYFLQHQVQKSEYGRKVLGQDSVLEFDAQYVGFAVTIKDTKFSQGAGHSSNIGTTYTVWAKLGTHGNLEDLMNALAAKVGIVVEKATV